MSDNQWGQDRLGHRQKRILRLMFDNGLYWPATLYMGYNERKTIESLVQRGYVIPTGVIEKPYRIKTLKISELHERYGMKAHING